jgi:DNA-binding transcriptional LysR family regulator
MPDRQVPRFSAHLLENRKLRQFITVAEELNFHRAAERLNMSQPPLSAAIKELEEVLNAKLFERDKKFVRLTPTGAAFLKEATLTLVQLERAVRVAREAEDGFIGRLRIGLSGSLGYGFLPSLLASFRQKYSHIKLDIFEGTSLEQIEAVNDGRVDVGFVRAPIPDSPAIDLKPVYRDRLIVVLPVGHRLARRPTIDIKDLADEDFVASSGVLVPGLRAQIDRVCRAAGFAPRVQCELHSVPSIVSLVSGGMGVALVPGATRVSRHVGVVYRELAKKTSGIDLEVLAIWRKGNMSRPVTNFLELAGR